MAQVPMTASEAMASASASPPQAFVVGIRTPRATRPRAYYEGVGRRIFDTSRMFGPYIDLLEDQDFALRKDPLAYQRMMRDGQIRAAIRIRQLATSARRVEWIPFPAKFSLDAKHYAGMVGELWEKMKQKNEAVLSILDAIPYGSSFCECVWKVGSDLRAYVERLVPLHKDRFVFSLDGQLAIRTPLEVFYGETVPPYTVVHHKYDPEPASYGDPEAEGRIYFGQGEFDRVYPWFTWKQVVLQLALRYTETLAYPNRVGRFPSRNPEAKAAISDLLSKMETSQFAVWPSDEGYDVDFLQAPTSGHQVIKDMLDYIDGQITKVILGSTLILDTGDKGSYALGTEQARHTFGAIAEHDARSLCDTLETTIGKWYMTMNHWDETLSPHATVAQGRATSLEDTVDVILSLIDRGYPISIETVSDISGIRPARPGETILAIPGLGMPGMGQPSMMEHGEGSDFEEDDDLDGVSKTSEEKSEQHMLKTMLLVPDGHNGTSKHSAGRMFLRDANGKFAPAGMGVVRVPGAKKRDDKKEEAPRKKESAYQKELKHEEGFKAKQKGGGGGGRPPSGNRPSLAGKKTPMKQRLLTREDVQVFEGGLKVKETSFTLEGKEVSWESLPETMKVIGLFGGEFPGVVVEEDSSGEITKDMVPEDALVREDENGFLIIHARIPIPM